MQIGRLARAAGVSVDTIRLYEARGMIRADRRANGYRDFTDEALVVVRLIRQGQALGFSLREIAEVLHGLQGEMSAEAVTDLLVARIAAEILASRRCRRCAVCWTCGCRRCAHWVSDKFRTCSDLAKALPRVGRK